MPEAGAPPSLKKGGGHGRTGGFGYMFQKAFDRPFKRALKDTMDAFHLPADNCFDEARTASIVAKLKTTAANNFKNVHEQLQGTEGAKEMKWSVVSDTIRRFVYGTYERHVIPVYMGSRGILQARTLALQGIARNRCKTSSQ